MNANYKLRGIYLVLDPALKREVLIPKLQEALEAGINLVQLWNHWPPKATHEEKRKLIEEVISIALPFDVPVLINKEWAWLRHTNLHGVHFDSIPKGLEQIKQVIGRNFITGLTCGNTPEQIRWAEAQQIDYISFCSMFPSSSVDTCEIVRPGSVLKARKITQIPIFLSGGIHPDNIDKLSHLDFQGLAVISGIMNTASVNNSIRAYKKALEKTKKIQL